MMLGGGEDILNPNPSSLPLPWEAPELRGESSMLSWQDFGDYSRAYYGDTRS